MIQQKPRVTRVLNKTLNRTAEKKMCFFFPFALSNTLSLKFFARVEKVGER